MKSNDYVKNVMRWGIILMALFVFLPGGGISGFANRGKIVGGLFIGMIFLLKVFRNNINEFLAKHKESKDEL